MTVEMPFGQLFGVLSEPLDRPVAGLCGVFLNAGAVRRSGPEPRLGRGRAPLGRPRRADAAGRPRGDRRRRRRRRAASPTSASSTSAAMTGAGLPDPRPAPGGRRSASASCSRGCARADTGPSTRPPTTSGSAPRFLLNPGALDWDPELEERRAARKLGGFSTRTAWWRRIGRGEVQARADGGGAPRAAAHDLGAGGRAARRLAAPPGGGRRRPWPRQRDSTGCAPTPSAS